IFPAAQSDDKLTLRAKAELPPGIWPVPPRLLNRYHGVGKRVHRLNATRDNGRGMFVRITLARLLVGTCAVALSACVLIEQARAQSTYIPAPTPLPPPVFNPSNPSTVAQPPYRPISPATRSTVPGYQVTVPVREPSARTATRSHRQTATEKTRVVHHRSRAVVRAEPAAYSYYYAPFGYGYGCAWQRTWDGFWFRTSPCS